MKLHKLNTSHLQYVESGQFIIRFLTDFKNSTLVPTEDAEFNALYQSLLQQSPIYDRALMQIQSWAESKKLMDLDYIRDRKMTTVRTVVSTFRHTDDEDEKKAYDLLMTLLRTYKRVEHMNFEAESLALDNFIAEIRSPRFSAAATKLALEKHLMNLEAANANFKTLFSNRSTNINTTEVFDTKALRKKILETYKDLAEYVLVMAKRKNTPFYAELLTILNTGRSYFSDLIARRKGTAAGTDPRI